MSHQGALWEVQNKSPQTLLLGADGITGGFAGGERGLQQFVEKGDLTFAEQNASELSLSFHVPLT